MTGGAGTERSLRYRPELDGMRAVAVVLVVIHHCVQPHRFSGFVGVDIFFVLSGFLITSILDTEIDRHGGLRLRVFYAKRLLRLYPALLAMLVVTLTWYRWLTHSLTAQLKDALFAATYTGNLSMTYRHEWIGPYTHTWSLALEEQYYLVWPLVLLVALRVGMPRRVLAGLVLLLGVVASAFTIHEFQFNSISFPVQSTSAGLLVGSALALGWAGVPALRRALGSRVSLALATLLFVFVLVAFSLTRRVADGTYVVAAVAVTALVIGYTGAHGGADPVSRTLARRPAVLLGRISYGVYLWHYPVLFLVNDLAPGWAPWARLAVVLPAAVAIATLSYRFVEMPFLRLKDRLGRRPRTPSTNDPSNGTPPGEPTGSLDDSAGAAPPATAR